MIDSIDSQKNLAESKPKPARSPLAQAVKRLRKGLGDTQQQFAVRVGVAIATAVRWETKKSPPPYSLARLYRLANENGMPDLAEVFRTAALGELGSVGVADDARNHLVDSINKLSDQTLSLLTSLEDERVTAEANPTTRPPAPGLKWLFMKCAERMIDDPQFWHLHESFMELVAPIREQLDRESEETLLEVRKQFEEQREGSK